LCGDCLEDREIAWKVCERWSDDVEAYMQLCGKTPLPDHNPECPRALDGAVTFLSPVQGGSYLLADGEMPVRVFSPGGRCTFFLDGRRISNSGQAFSLPLDPGRYTLSCIDAQGRSAKVQFRCEEAEAGESMN
jgi:membrane carboxypeptidase/penicillin-binding protein PbpC